MIPSTSLFAIITYSLINQISFFLVLYIAKRKFFPAMNSRITDAFHLNNRKVYLEQRRLLKRHKTLIYFLLFTFELYILKDLLFYNLYMIFESICLNSCWFMPPFLSPSSQYPTLSPMFFFHSAGFLLYYHICLT